MSVLTAVVILASVTIVSGSVFWLTLRESARETREFVRSTREAILHSSMEFRQLHRVDQAILMRIEKISEENQRILKDLSIMIGRIDERMDNA